MTAYRSAELPPRTAPERPLSIVARGDRADRSVDQIELPTDVVCRLLSNRRRRAVVELVAALGADEGTTLGDLAVSIAAREAGIDRRRVTSSQRKSAYVSLLQCHLPKLDDAGVIDWDERGGGVTRGEGIDELAWLIGVIERTCVP